MIPTLVPSFRQYLATQPLDRQLAIRGAERQYVRSRHLATSPDGFVGDPAERAYLESLEGWTDTPPADLTAS